MFLTPLIKAGKIKEAQHAAKVELLGQDVKSYSGYLTVGLENCGSNLFFWFFPAMVNIYIHISYHRDTGNNLQTPF